MGCGCGGKKSRIKFAQELARKKAEKEKNKKKKEQISE